MMADKPIIFSAPMVRALLDGRKTQTRRVPKIAWEAGVNRDFTGWRPEQVGPRRWQLIGGFGVGANIKTAYAVGDRLWVREHWRTADAYDDLAPSQLGGEEPIIYLADDTLETWGWRNDFVPGRFRQAMHMPRWASRITLTVSDVRVQRLQEISEVDAVAEGCEATGWRPTYGNPDNAGFEETITAKDAFADIWNSLHGPGAWDANPWVAAHTFTVQRGNIDSPKESPND